MHLLVRRLARLAPLAAATLVACGGSIVKVGPADAGGDGPVETCPDPSVVGSAASCSVAGQSCAGSVQVSFCGGTGAFTSVDCTCGDGIWQCPDVGVGAGCPAQPTCPAQADVTPGGECGVDPTLSCNSNVPITDCSGAVVGYLACSCLSSAWNCAMSLPVCPEDAGPGCPPPDSTYAGQACAYYATTCGGDPQTCGGATLYDALQCSAGVWTVAAATTCDVDGG